MKAIGKVLSVNDSNAVVLSQRNSACSSCHNCECHGSCHAELVFGNQSENVTVCAKNIIKAKPGDIVELESSTLKTLLVSFIVFVMPLILTGVFYYILSLTNKISQADFLPILLIVLYFLLFFIFSFMSNIYVKRNASVSIVKIIEECK